MGSKLEVLVLVLFDRTQGTATGKAREVIANNITFVLSIELINVCRLEISNWRKG